MAAPQQPGFTLVGGLTVSAQEQYDIASWRTGQESKLLFPVQSVTDSISQRLVGHRRPYRQGAKFDSTGAEPRRWVLAVVFNVNIYERGLEQNGRDLFPDVYRELQRSAELQETGDLVVPGVGAVRARFESLQGNETFEEPDTARATLTFVQDNEESLDRALLRPPSARATTRRLAETTVFTAQAVGAWDGDLNGLIEFAAEVENLLLAPGRATNAVETQVRRNRRAIERIVDAQNQLAEDVGLDTNRPRGSSMERQAVLLRDRQAQAAGERSAGRPRTRPFRIDVPATNIFEVAARFDQDAEELMQLNDSRIGDPMLLTRGQVVLVFATRPRA